MKPNQMKRPYLFLPLSCWNDPKSPKRQSHSPPERTDRQPVGSVHQSTG